MNVGLKNAGKLLLSFYKQTTNCGCVKITVQHKGLAGVIWCNVISIRAVLPTLPLHGALLTSKCIPSFFCHPMAGIWSSSLSSLLLHHPFLFGDTITRAISNGVWYQIFYTKLIFNILKSTELTCGKDLCGCFARDVWHLVARLIIM